MMVEVVNGGETAFNALMYPPPDNNMLNYLQSNIAAAKDALAMTGSRFMENIVNMYNKFNSQDAIAASKAILYNVGEHMNENIIYPLNVDQVFNANLLMQRYIMAQPDVSKLYDRNMCHGFEETYVDPEPDTPLKEKYYYRSVMDGMLDFDKDGVAFYDTYSQTDELAQELDVMDKIAILDTWNSVANLIADGIDPTSPNAEEL